MSFSIQVPAKCILAGEHAILRQGFAIVAPFKKYHVYLDYIPNETNTMATISGDGYNSMQVLLWPVVRHALELLNKTPSKLKGYFNIRTTLPVGAGLGFSAAISVAVARWVADEGWIKQADIFEFAVQLEDIFHGHSSGVDIAGVMSTTVVQYFTTHEIKLLTPRWQPKLYVSNSKIGSITKNCIDKIKQFRAENEAKAKEIDDKMSMASFLVKEALESNQEQGFLLLTKGLNLGNHCYYDWGLVSPQLNEHIMALQQQALAVKIIGAGFGGHVLSLWEKEPPANFPIKLYPLSC